MLAHLPIHTELRLQDSVSHGPKNRAPLDCTQTRNTGPLIVFTHPRNDKSKFVSSVFRIPESFPPASPSCFSRTDSLFRSCVAILCSGALSAAKKKNRRAVLYRSIAAIATCGLRQLPGSLNHVAASRSSNHVPSAPCSSLPVSTSLTTTSAASSASAEVSASGVAGRRFSAR